MAAINSRCTKSTPHKESIKNTDAPRNAVVNHRGNMAKVYQKTKTSPMLSDV